MQLTEPVVAQAEARAADEVPDLAAEASSIVVEKLCPDPPPTQCPEAATGDRDGTARRECLAWAEGQIGRAKFWNA